MDDIQSQSFQYWEKFYANYDQNVILVDDDWLDRFEHMIDECRTPIPDLGCEGNHNTSYLMRKHKSVIACNFSPSALAHIRQNFPDIYATEQFDLVDGMPFSDSSFDLIIADLCLHYFTEKDTFAILTEIKRTLKAGGHLLFRVNSVNDINYAAKQGEEIEHHLYKTPDNRLKRFFDSTDIKHFFKDFKVEYLREESTSVYGPEKTVFVGCVEK